MNQHASKNGVPPSVGVDASKKAESVRIPDFNPLSFARESLTQPGRERRRRIRI